MVVTLTADGKEPAEVRSGPVTHRMTDQPYRVNPMTLKVQFLKSVLGEKDHSYPKRKTRNNRKEVVNRVKQSVQ